MKIQPIGYQAESQLTGQSAFIYASIAKTLRDAMAEFKKMGLTCIIVTPVFEDSIQYAQYREALARKNMQLEKEHKEQQALQKFLDGLETERN